jgi:transposase
LLPLHVQDVLGEEHLCFFLHEVVERLDLSVFAAEYREEGPRPYAPALTVKVWLYAYCLQVTSSRWLEQRIKADLAFRYLAGGAQPDHWTLNAFRTRHRWVINDLFLQVAEVARGLGMGRLGHVAIDSTRVHAHASRRRMETQTEFCQRLAWTRRAIRRGQQQCDVADPNEEPGTRVKSGGPGSLPAAAAGVGGAGVRSAERATRHAAPPPARTAQGGNGSGPVLHGL